MFPASSNMKLVLVITILSVVAYEGEGFEGNHYRQILEGRGTRLQNRFFWDILDTIFGSGRRESDNTSAYVVVNPSNTQHFESWAGSVITEGAGSHDGGKGHGSGAGGSHDGGKGSGTGAGSNNKNDPTKKNPNPGTKPTGTR